MLGPGPRRAAGLARGALPRRPAGHPGADPARCCTRARWPTRSAPSPRSTRTGTTSTRWLAVRGVPLVAFCGAAAVHAGPALRSTRSSSVLVVVRVGLITLERMEGGSPMSSEPWAVRVHDLVEDLPDQHDRQPADAVQRGDHAPRCAIPSRARRRRTSTRSTDVTSTSSRARRSASSGATAPARARC